MDSMVGRWQVNDQLMPNLHYSGHLCSTCSFQGNRGTSISCSCTSSRLLKPFGPQVSLHRSSKWLLGHSGSHTRCLRKLGGDDLDERVIPLHITSFIKGLSWPSKGDGQWSFNPPQPPILRPLFPFPLCPTPSPSLLTQGENYFEPGEYSSIEMEKGLYKRGWSLKIVSLFYGGCASLEGKGW